jgi:hypothetical protein
LDHFESVPGQIPISTRSNPNRYQVRSQSKRQIIEQLFLLKNYNMFFLITHATFNKFYPNKFTQFVIGIIFYFVAFMILREIIDGDLYEEYKFHLVSLLIIDASYLIYLHHFSNRDANDKSDIINTQTPVNPSTTSMFSKNDTDVKNNNNASPSYDDIYILSEMNDFKVMHDVSDTEHDDVFGSDDMQKNNNCDSLNTKSKTCSSDNIKLSSLMKSVNASDEYSANDQVMLSDDLGTCSSNGPTLSDHILPHDDQFLSSENNTEINS